MSCNSPLMFESDEENHEPLEVKVIHENTVSCAIENCELLSQNDSSSIQEKSEEQILVEHLHTVLTGVPPPPAVTVSQYDAGEILHCLKENYTNFEWSATKDDKLKREENEKLAKTEEWPSVRDHFWYNVSYNRGALSEELALLTDKYQERYVGNETSSSVNSFFTKSLVCTASAKKRARRHAWGHSPGRRLSHLARRRHTFSSANLQQNAAKSLGLPEKKKMILIDKRKSVTLKGNKTSTCKTLGSAKKKKIILQPTVNSSKRALFQSPESGKKGNTKKLVLSDKSRSSPRTKSAQRSKRALWPDPPCLQQEIPDKGKENGKNLNNSLNDKRLAANSLTGLSPKRKCLRNLSFTEDSSIKGMPKLQPETLSQLHKKKLLWAVSDALRSEGIGMDHSYAKVCISELFKICKEIWLKKFINEEKTGSTSDRMLQLAKKFSSDVVKKVKIRLGEIKNSDSSISLLVNKSDINSNSTVTASVNTLVSNKASCVKMCLTEPSNTLCNNSNKSCKKSNIFKDSVKSDSTDTCIPNKINTNNKLLDEDKIHKKELHINLDFVLKEKSIEQLNGNEQSYDFKSVNNKNKSEADMNLVLDNCSSFGNIFRYSNKTDSPCIDETKCTPLSNIDMNNVNEDAVNIIGCKEEFSPCPSWVPDDTTRCSSSCDIDMTGIIESIDSSNSD